MFVVLKVQEKQGGFINSIRERLKPTKPELKKVYVKGGAPFFVLNMIMQKGEIDWEKVVYHSGRCANSMLIEDGIVPPEDSGVSTFVPQYLPLILLFNKAMSRISDDVILPKLRRMTVIDKDAILARHIEKAVAHVGEITVITDNEERYEEVSERIMRDTGAVIRLVEEIDPFANYIISSEIKNFKTNASVFCLEHSEISAGEIITLDDFNLPDEYEQLRPYSIDALTFASALYELCGVREVEDLMQGGSDSPRINT